MKNKPSSIGSTEIKKMARKINSRGKQKRWGEYI
jgi:hypothetical protein